MPLDAAVWDCYVSARSEALRGYAASADAKDAVERVAARLKAYLGLADDQATNQARRAFLYAGDAAFHDQLLATGRIDILRMAVERLGDLPLRPGATAGAGMLAVSLHYGPATALLPLWLAMASGRGLLGEVGVIENSRRNPSVMLSARRHAELAACGFPFADLDMATLGELGAMRRALAILRDGGIVLIFADGQLPQPSAKRTLRCRLGCRPLALPCGTQWLAETAGVPLKPLWLRPERDSHGLMDLPLCLPSGAERAVQALIDTAMAADPAPWGRWCSSAAHL